MKYRLPVSGLEVDTLDELLGKLTVAELPRMRAEFRESDGYFREWLEYSAPDVFDALRGACASADLDDIVFIEVLFKGFEKTDCFKMLSCDAKEVKTWRLATEAENQRRRKTPGGLNTAVELPGGIPLELVWCPPGTFWMGSPEDEADRWDDELQHRVTLTKGFWIGKTVVTQAQWKAVMGRAPRSSRGLDLPVENVSFYDCEKFFKKIYTLVSGFCFRLPTAAEWEYACRAGTNTAFCYGNRLGAKMANFKGNNLCGGGAKENCSKRTTPVCSFRPNAWGLYDVHGNVWEWCSDLKGDYSAGLAIDPAGAPSGRSREIRGGSWSNDAGNCRSAFRDSCWPTCRYDNLGFRLVRSLPEPTERTPVCGGAVSF